MTIPYPVKFRPIPMERVWGGNQLKSWFSHDGDEPIGEYWVLSGHPNGTSIAVNGEFAGRSLVELCELHPEAYLGNSPQDRFPLLVKFLEATSDLSVQVHPDDTYAKAHEGDYGKTEAWYVLDCKEDGRVNYGHSFASPEEYRQAVADGRVKDYLAYEPIQPGQLVYVPAQTLHALLAGTIVIEVQQTSDVTYRVYDWDRVDASGNGRELHVDKAQSVLTYEGIKGGVATAVATPRVIQIDDAGHHERLVESDYFTLEKVRVQADEYLLKPGRDGNPDVLIVADGSGELVFGEESLPLTRGDTLLVPSTMGEYTIKSEGELTVLRTYY